ncbi:anti-adapter protein IraP [Chimaeribacter arupi]|uniref:Anti-adapter protein IraP n=2 Tax=Yersiniaceae TaxID=1903411 RepID=A0A2N5ENZ6_9GAMM|nr:MULTISPECIES: anti-adapter protein IraP [Yersiniaceae]MBS0970587.1 anti-adapter protein IraP [Nissabacter archeti]MDV5141079.1 anti-adapter protein IraP [Chimaeribacter arupi]PLR36164.1 anti-adapter protein IraP [Chimaeribacter arupi]PLR48213.1 anti-adapter protein IraP [Chimaeribacter arupi]PLR48789.1 anti-adapter protein IraP [Chimaeribacter arupi]
MQNLVADVLIKMSKIEVEAKELTAQVEAQSLLLAAIILTLDKTLTENVTQTINQAIVTAAKESDEIMTSDVDLLLSHVGRLLALPEFVKVKSE